MEEVRPIHPCAEELLTGEFLFSPFNEIPWQYRDLKRVEMSLNEVYQRFGFFKNRLVVPKVG